MKLPLLILTLVLVSCNWTKQKAKDTVNKAGEVVAKTGSEFVSGVSKGIEKTFQNQVVISDQLKESGLRTGKIIIHGTDSSVDNILSAYLIFDGNIDQNITIKAISEERPRIWKSYAACNSPKKGKPNTLILFSIKEQRWMEGESFYLIKSAVAFFPISIPFFVDL